jgi:hypothetical protein
MDFVEANIEDEAGHTLPIALARNFAREKTPFPGALRHQNSHLCILSAINRQKHPWQLGEAPGKYFDSREQEVARRFVDNPVPSDLRALPSPAPRPLCVQWVENTY